MQSVRARLVGTWKLVSTEETLKDGSTRPFPQFGQHGKGFLMYQADGYVCAILVNPDRPKCLNRVRTTLEDQVPAADTAFAYCGCYQIDVERNQIIHLPEVATDPNYTGSRQIRPYQFEGERLIFSGVEKDNPVVSRWKIIWEKVR